MESDHQPDLAAAHSVQLLVQWSGRRATLDQFADELRKALSESFASVVVEGMPRSTGVDGPTLLVTFESPVFAKPLSSHTAEWIEAAQKVISPIQRLRRRRAIGKLRMSMPVLSAVAYLASIERKGVHRLDQAFAHFVSIDDPQNSAGSIPDWQRSRSWWFGFYVNDSLFYVVEVGSNGRWGYYFRRDLREWQTFE